MREAAVGVRVLEEHPLGALLLSQTDSRASLGLHEPSCRICGREGLGPFWSVIHPCLYLRRADGPLGSSR